MRVGIVRTDLSKIYLSDVENSSQRNFSSQPRGQSRYFRHPTDAQIATMLGQVAPLTIRGSDTAVDVDTTGANATKLNIRAGASGPFTQVTVTSNAALTKVQIVTELNTAFANAGLGLSARISGTNQITIDTTTVKGPGAAISVSASSPSTAALHTVLGIAAADSVGLTVAALKAAVYPTGVTIDVSPATINALGTFPLLSAGQLTTLDAGVADLIAPRLVETGPAIRSFAFGILSKMRSALFQPGGTRSGLPAGIAAAIVDDDGVTPFSV